MPNIHLIVGKKGESYSPDPRGTYHLKYKNSKENPPAIPFVVEAIVSPRLNHQIAFVYFVFGPSKEPHSFWDSKGNINYYVKNS